MLRCKGLECKECVLDNKEVGIGKVAFHLFAYDKSPHATLIEVGNVEMSVANFSLDGKEEC